nr:reverse transcriptase domain-containing protein [Tanacetum cinerariifolium]
TRSSSNLPVESPPNPSTSNPKHRDRKRSKQPFILEESLVGTMADQRTMAELLRAPTEVYVKAIVVPPILVDQFKLKYTLINDHIRWGSPSVSKFINEFFPSLRTKNLRNEISNFQQRFDESFHEAWDRYKDLLRDCPHHGFTELHQLDTFYNALNLADQDSLNSAAGGNLLERRAQDVLTIIEKKSKCYDYRHDNYSQTDLSNLPPSFVKAVKDICVTCGGAHPYYQCLAAAGNTFPELKDNIQGYVAAAAVNYNQGNFVYRPMGVANQFDHREDEREEETLTDQDLAEYTIKVPPLFV